MPQRFTGVLIGAPFGMLFVVLNAHEPLTVATGVALRVFAVLALAGLVVIVTSARRRADATGTSASRVGPQTSGLRTRYWLVVAAEVLLIVVGLAVLRSWNTPQETNIAWIAFVVGTHLIALLVVWGRRSIVAPGVVLAALGLAGLVMTATPAVAWVPFVSGVLSGVTLLAFSLSFATRELARRSR